MNIMNWIYLVGGVTLLLIIGLIVFKKRPRKLKVHHFMDQWKDLQNYCKDKGYWASALIEADKLFDVALKKRRFKGRSMGERMVSAQRHLTDNDAIWFAHNLVKKLKADASVHLHEDDVKNALVGFRQALRDLGALESVGKQEEANREQA